MYTIQDLAEGKCVVINDGTFGELIEVLKLAFPKDREPVATCKYYKRTGNFSWGGFNHKDNLNHLPLQSVKDFLKEEFVLPEKWRVVANKETAEYAKCEWYEEYPVGVDYFYFINNTFIFWSSKNDIQNEYKLISLENFKKYVMKKTYESPNTIESRFPFKLSLKNAKRIINVACNTWKTKLENLWAVDLLRNEYVSISEEFYKEMRKACTEKQHELFDEIFGRDSKEINLRDKSTIKNLELFLESGNGDICLICIREGGEFQNKAFYLSDLFNWEIKEDEHHNLCLIPTKK